MKCKSGKCYSPVACEGFGYCRELNMAKTFHDGKITLHAGDCLDVLKAMPGNSIDSVVTDPPYHLTSIVKRFGGANSAPAKGNDAFIRASRGFMGKQWDGGDIAFRPELWAEVLRVLKPGGHMVAFSGTRTYHRMAVAIENAGFEIRDQLAWLYGSGFPKSHDVSKGIDRRGGNPQLAAEIGRAIKVAREKRGLSASECDARFCDGSTNWSWFEGRSSGVRAPSVSDFAKIVAEWPELKRWADAVAAVEREVVGTNPNVLRSYVSTSCNYEVNNGSADITAPATDSARQWQGYGTSLKPSQEPIAFCTKPLPMTAIFGILLQNLGQRLWNELCQKCPAPVNDAEKDLQSFLRSCEKAGANSVAELARTSVLENPEHAAIAAINSILREPISPKATEYSARENVKHPGNECISAERETRTSAAVVTSFSPVISALLSRPTNIGWNIFSLWRNISDGVLDEARTYTIETALDQITAWKTFSFLLSPNMRDSTLSSENRFSPELEKACLARKPLSESTVAANVLRWGTGAINIDGCRINPGETIPGGGNGQANNGGRYGAHETNGSRPIVQPHSAGRWPANLCHDGSPEVLAGFPNGESRYFYTSKADADDRLRSLHPTVKPVDLMQWLVKLVCPKGATVLDPFAGTGTTGAASFIEGRRCVLIEREAEYLADIEKRMGILLSGSEERSWKLAKPEPLEALPLFALPEPA